MSKQLPNPVRCTSKVFFKSDLSPSVLTTTLGQATVESFLGFYKRFITGLLACTQACFQHFLPLKTVTSLNSDIVMSHPAQGFPLLTKESQDLSQTHRAPQEKPAFLSLSCPHLLTLCSAPSSFLVCVPCSSPQPVLSADSHPSLPHPHCPNLTGSN